MYVRSDWAFCFVRTAFGDGRSTLFRPLLYIYTCIASLRCVWLLGWFLYGTGCFADVGYCSIA